MRPGTCEFRTSSHFIAPTPHAAAWRRRRQKSGNGRGQGALPAPQASNPRSRPLGTDQRGTGPLRPSARVRTRCLASLEHGDDGCRHRRPVDLVAAAKDPFSFQQRAQRDEERLAAGEGLRDHTFGRSALRRSCRVLCRFRGEPEVLGDRLCVKKSAAAQLPGKPMALASTTLRRKCHPLDRHPHPCPPFPQSACPA